MHLHPQLRVSINPKPEPRPDPNLSKKPDIRTPENRFTRKPKNQTPEISDLGWISKNPIRQKTQFILFIIIL